MKKQVLRVAMPESQQARKERRQQRQAKLAELADKKAKGKLTLEDIDEKLDMIIKILQDLMPPK